MSIQAFSSNDLHEFTECSREQGRKGQRVKQQRDRERMLERGEISEDEPTYYSQGRGKGGQGQRGGQQRGRKQQQYESDEDQDYESKGYDDSPGHKMTPQEKVRGLRAWKLPRS